jgi:hypothetical protein
MSYLFQVGDLRLTFSGRMYGEDRDGGEWLDESAREEVSVVENLGRG